MRLRTIWTMPTLTLRERLSRTGEWFWTTLAAALPRKLRYWVAIQEIGRATMDADNVPAATVTHILPRLAQR